MTEHIEDLDVYASGYRVGVSSGNLLEPEDLEVMNDGAIVFAMANPVPEVDPVDAGQHATVVATGVGLLIVGPQ